MAARKGLEDAHEWVSFEDPEEERTWVFDVTFLTSNWKCIYGCGCPGVLTGPAPEMVQGCCSYGAHFTDEADVERVERAAAELERSQWQYQSRARGKPFKQTHRGETVTRIVDGACIFLNRPGFPGGPGCALHRAALERGMPPLELKPDVCWQLPLRREDEDGPEGHVRSTVRQWDRRDWGGGGSEFHWWCTESHEAFVGTEPVYKTLRTELTAMVGEANYKTLARYLERIRPTETRLPHPALRR